MEGVRTSRNPIDLLRDTEESSISLSRLEMMNLICTETSSVSFDYMCCDALWKDIASKNTASPSLHIIKGISTPHGLAATL